MKHILSLLILIHIPLCFPAIKESDILTLLESGITKPYDIALNFYTCKSDDSKALCNVLTQTKAAKDNLKVHIDFLNTEIKKPDNKEYLETLNQLLPVATENLSLLNQLHDLFWCKNPGTFWNLLKLKSIVSPPISKLHLVEKKLNAMSKDAHLKTLITTLDTTKTSTTRLKTTVGTSLTSKASEFKKKLKLIGTARTQI